MQLPNLKKQSYNEGIVTTMIIKSAQHAVSCNAFAADSTGEDNEESDDHIVDDDDAENKADE